ncbi:peroxiredoxin family protein [Xenophilus azovorans]|uniref:peroxiredoxin family protein n=1 Tax=Xenophilus azovorans TaxID=151755 RepID=UPI0005700862|nr:redoxin domain-containing protein [Xenophilus azovorans]
MALELRVSHWFNTPAPPTLAALRGRVVVLHAFQMLCPGCVAHGLPQAQRVHRCFPAEQLVVLGLHTVFEHHAVMGSAEALQAFIHEYRLDFPIGIDQQPDGARGVPLTMQALQLRGTPSLVVLDRQGGVRLHHFGAIDDLHLGALLGGLVAEPAGAVPEDARPSQGCEDGGCMPPSASPAL